MTGGTRYEWDIEMYDPSNGRFTRAGSIAKEGGIIKRPVTAVQLADGRIIAFGPPAGVGGDASDWGSTGIYLIDPLAGHATLMNEIDGCDAVSHAIAVDDGRVLVICYGPRSWLELVDVDTGRTSVLDGILAENAGPLLRLPDGRIAFSAGVGVDNLSIVDAGSGQVVETTVPISPAGIPELTLLEDGRVLVTGGPGATLWIPRPVCRPPSRRPSPSASATPPRFSRTGESSSSVGSPRHPIPARHDRPEPNCSIHRRTDERDEEHERATHDDRARDATGRRRPGVPRAQRMQRKRESERRRPDGGQRAGDLAALRVTGSERDAPRCRGPRSNVGCGLL